MLEKTDSLLSEGNNEVNGVDKKTVLKDLEKKEVTYKFDVKDAKKLEEGSNCDVSLESGDRATWGGKMEFILTCVGYAVGLGNVWRFPYLCFRNGGGAFLIPYVIMLAFVGLPLFYMELAFGQFASLGPITIWKINPLFKGLGYCMVLVSWLIGLYYNVIIAHVLFYLVSSMTDSLPWIGCNHDWNTENCFDSFTNSSNVTVTNDTKLMTSPSVEYYNRFVLEKSGDIGEAGEISWKMALALLVAWAIVYIVLIRGIQSLGKVVYFTAIFPYVMLTILLIRGVTLEGAEIGIRYYLTPDFSRLADARVWTDAATQIFYSLSACSGGLIAMASYNKFDNNCYRDALIVALINCGTSIYAGLVIFSVLGFMAFTSGKDVSEVADGGPGLAFVVYPEAISRMPVSTLWAILFFFMMATLGFGSQFSIMECILSAFTDEFPRYLRPKWNSIAFRTAVIVLSFLLGLPMITKGGIYVLNLVDYSVSGFPLLFVGLFECIALNWIYGYERFAEDIEMMLGHKPNIYWKACWMVISPVVIIFTIVFNCIQYKDPTLDDYDYPAWAVSLGWCIAMFPILFIPVWFLYSYCKNGGWQFTRTLMQPLPEWGPANESDKQGTLYESNQKVDSGETNFAYNSQASSLNLTQSNLTLVTNTSRNSPVVISKSVGSLNTTGLSIKSISRTSSSVIDLCMRAESSV